MQETNQIVNIAGYKFITLNELSSLRTHFLDFCLAHQLKGTILLSPEGINIFLAGFSQHINEFNSFLAADARFSDITFRISYSDTVPFKRLKVKLKKEIITFRQPDIAPVKQRAQSVSPEQFKQWLDDNHPVTILDTRNDFEIQFGTFNNAINLQINDFCEFTQAPGRIPSDKPIVMFCTGGIRCEKAALYLEQHGFDNVFQLEGGILNYFEKVGGVHYQGACFVFDERIALNSQLKSTTTTN